MAESVNRNIEIKQAAWVDATGQGATFADHDTTTTRSTTAITVVQYHAAAAAGLVQRDAPHARLLSTANASANSLFYGGCALVTEPTAAGGNDEQVLYITSNLLQTTDSAQLPVVLITRAVVSRDDDDALGTGRITAVRWTKLRAPPMMPTPAALIPYHDGHASGVLYCAQGNMTPGSSGLFFMPRGRRPRAVVNSYYGRALNSVRDVAVHPRDAALWFTDPPAGHYDHGVRPAPQLPAQVYRAAVGAHDGHAHDLRAMAGDGLSRPTSLCFSPAGDVLYVSDTASQSIYAYDVRGGGGGGEDFATNRRLFAHAVCGVPLCVRCDAKGNVFVACTSSGSGSNGSSGGLEIWSARGSLLAVLDVPGPGGGVSSFCFTSARCDELILCAGQELWWMQLREGA